MPERFLVDAQLPPALARWLAANGHSAEHVADRQLEAAFDTVIWDCALQDGTVIITKDENFALRKILGNAGPVVLWIRLPNAGRRDLVGASRACFPISSRRCSAARP